MGRNRRRGRFDGGLGVARPSRLEVPGELHDQDGVFAGERDHQDQADLRVQIVVVAAAQLGQEDAHEGDGHDEDDRGGRRPALV